jgi:hypothetical protein
MLTIIITGTYSLVLPASAHASDFHKQAAIRVEGRAQDSIVYPFDSNRLADYCEDRENMVGKNDSNSWCKLEVRLTAFSVTNWEVRLDERQSSQ